MNSDAPRGAKISLASVFFTFFVDNLCWSIVFPIFAPYFLDPHNSLFAPELPDSTRAVILGFFLMAFSLGQFLGGPIVGEYADRHGRKKALTLTVACTLFGLALTAWSMQSHHLVFLFLGRLITGIFSSNTAICLACITDLSGSEKIRIKRFGYFSVVAGLSFVMGAFIGGTFSDPTINSSFAPDFPLWLACALTVFNLLFIVFGFKETAQIDRLVKFDFLESFRNIKQALKTEKIKRIYFMYFLFLIAWTILFQFSPVVVVQRFGFTGSNIGDLAVLMGLCWAIGAGYLNKLLLHYFSQVRILEVSLIVFTILSACIMLPKHLYGTLSLLGACVIIGGLAWPLCTGMISSLAPREIQGKIMGMSQSVQSLAMTIAPVVGGIAYKASLALPFLIGAGASLIAAVIYCTLKER